MYLDGVLQQLPELEGLVVLNINSWSAGCCVWNDQSTSDHFGASRLEMGRESGCWGGRVGAGEGEWEIRRESGCWEGRVGAGEGEWEIRRESGRWEGKVEDDRQLHTQPRCWKYASTL